MKRQKEWVLLFVCELSFQVSVVRPYSFALLGSLEIDVDIQQRVSDFIRGKDLLRSRKLLLQSFVFAALASDSHRRQACCGFECSYMSVDDEPDVEMTDSTSKGSFDTARVNSSCSAR